MNHDSAEGAAARERLSALADGELDAAEVMRACASWRDESEARSTWHAYQLIGDVLRSDDLATGSARDAAFLAGLRERLAREPIVLAPQTLTESAEPAQAAVESMTRMPAHRLAGARVRRRAWVGASAVAAGFVVVAGALVLTRAPGDAPGAQPAGADRLALAASGAAIGGTGQPVVQAAAARTTGAAAVEPAALVANGKLIRDARLDRYLAAHKQFAGTSALGVPSGFLRAATAVESER